MVLLEDEHGPEAYGALAAAADVDAERLGLLEEGVARGVVEGDEGPLPLSAQVLELAGVFLGEPLELRVEVVADAGRVGDEVVALDLVDDGAEEQRARRVAHPRVELAVRLVGPQARVAVVVAGRLGLLAEGHHVRGVGQVPVVVGPELSRGADARLHLVDDEQDAVLLGQGPQLAEELRRRVVVAALRLHRLHDDGGGRHVVVLDKVLDLGEGFGLSHLVLPHVLLERVLELREGGVRPVEGRDVELVDRL